MQAYHNKSWEGWKKVGKIDLPSDLLYILVLELFLFFKVMIFAIKTFLLKLRAYWDSKRWFWWKKGKIKLKKVENGDD